MIRVKTIYYDIAGVVKNICDKTYYQDRPTAIDSKIGSYLVISLPSDIKNNELNPSGEYNDYSTTVLLEVYVRDKMSAQNPVGIDLKTMDEKVNAVMTSFPINTLNIQVTRPEIAMQSNDDSGFHITLIRAKLRTK